MKKSMVLFYVLAAAAVSLIEACEKPRMEESLFLYTEQGGKEYFDLRKDMLIIRTNSETHAEELCKKAWVVSGHNVGIWALVSIDPDKTTLNDVLELSEVVDVHYGLENGTVIHFPTDRIYAKFKDALTPEEILERVGLTKYVVSIELSDEHTDGYDIVLDVRLTEIMGICNMLYKSGLAEASPVFFRLMNGNI